MNVVRIAAAPPYEAAGHERMGMVRLQGREAGPAESVWLGLSTLAPGGGTMLDTSEVEKFYVVWSGEVTVSNGSETVTLGPLDSVRIAPGEPRQLRNATDRDAMILLAMPIVTPKRSA